MKYILIGTTALNRPGMHSDNIREWLNWIKKDNDYKFIWFINIDNISKLKETYKKTKLNFINIINGDIDKVFFFRNPNGKGDFLEACKRIVINMNNYLNELIKEDCSIILSEDIKIFWLEDDWKFNIQCEISFKYLIDNISSNKSHINLTNIRENYIWALAPSILSYELWYNLFYKGWTLQKENIDPEHCLGLFFLKHYAQEINNTKKNTPKTQNITNLTLIRKKENMNTDKYLINSNSYYSLIHETEYMENNNVKINDIIKKFENTYVFIRIKPSFVIDGVLYGRKYMENYNIIKKKIMDANNTDFYT